MIHILIISLLIKTVLFVETTKLFISNSVRIFYLYVPGVRPLTSLFCPGADCSGVRVLPPSILVPVDGFG